MDEIAKILSQVRPEAEFSRSTDFFADGLLDSFDMISLITAIENRFSVNIDGLQIVPENFCSVQAIAETIIRSGGAL